MSRGVSLRLGNIQIIFGPDGEVTGPPIKVEVSLNMGPFWLEIALSHLEIAQRHHASLLAVMDGPDQNAIGQALEGEFLAGMQAIVASATALDALYASVKPHVELPAETIRAWQDRGTARYKQVAEVLRRGSILKPRKAVAWRKLLGQIYQFRDWAVHPSSDFTAPVPHPDLLGATERRFVAFSYSNARASVRAALAMTLLLSSKYPVKAPTGLAEVYKGISAMIAPACAEWRAKYGPLTDDPEIEHRAAGGGEES